MSEPKVAEKRLPLWRKITFGLTAPPLQMTANIVGFYFSLFLLEVVHLSPAKVSAILLTGRVWDAVTDPIVGQLLSKSNFGKRVGGRTRFWLLIASPCGAAAFAALWQHVPFCNGAAADADNAAASAAAAGGDAACFVYYLIIYLMYCTFITCYHLPYTASTMLISSHSSDKDEATAARIGCELIATVVGCGVFGFVISGKRIAIDCDSLLHFNGSAIADDVAVVEEQTAYRIGGVAISSIFLLCGCIGILSIRERVKLERGQLTHSLIVNVRAVLRFRPYLLLMGAFLFMSLAIQTVQANLALFTTHSLRMGNHTQTGILTVLSVAVVAVPMWHFLAQRFGKKAIFAAGLLPLGPCLLFAMLMPEQHSISYYGIAIIAGLSISVAMLMPWSMLPDVIDSYYLETGQRREATFYSLYVFFNKFAAGVSLAASQLALAAGNYNSELCTQAESVGLALRILIGPAPLLFIALSLLFIWHYPINKLVRNQMDHDLRLKSEPESSIQSSNKFDLADAATKETQSAPAAEAASQAATEAAATRADKAAVALLKPELHAITDSDAMSNHSSSDFPTANSAAALI